MEENIKLEEMKTMSIYEELKEKYSEIEQYSEVSGDWEEKGIEAFKKGNYKVAIENYKKVIVAIPEHYNAYEMCSYALYEGGEEAKAIKYIEKAVENAKAFEGEAKLPDEMVEDMERSLETMKKGEELDRGYLEEIME